MTNIIRFTGDDDPHALLIQIKKIGATELTPLDLDLVTQVQFAFKYKDSPVVIYTCVKDSNPKSGLVYIPFVSSDVLIATKGIDYDVSVIWSANSKKRTLGKDKLILNEDVNKS